MLIQVGWFLCVAILRACSTSGFVSAAAPMPNTLIATTRHLISVSTQSALVGALTNNGVIDFSANIYVTSTIDIDGFTGVIIDGANHFLDGKNKVRCIRILNNAEVAISNLVIKNGSASTEGGGVYINTATASMTSCTITSSSAVYGGGLYVTSSIATLSLCTFSLNTATYGGGIEAWEGATLDLNSCTFDFNIVSEKGGGVYINEASNSTMISCTFTSNSAASEGGGLFVVTSIATLSLCTFSANTAPYGAGTSASQGTTLNMESCNIYGNSAASEGGGLFVDASIATLSLCNFTENTAQYGGGIEAWQGATLDLNCCTFDANVVSGKGGGLWVGGDSTASTSTMVSCTFISNSAASEGGGLFVTQSIATLSLCNFIKNTAQYGGGIEVYQDSTSNPSTLNLESCNFNFNVASNDGGGVYIEKSTSTMSSCTFFSNTAADKGGGIYILTVSSSMTSCTFNLNTAEEGGGLFVDASTATLSTCTLSANNADYGGGIGMREGATLDLESCYFNFNVASNDGGGVYSGITKSGESSSTMTSCTFKSNTATNDGGVLFMNNAEVRLTRSTLTSNHANEGGCIYILNGELEVIGCTFSNNTVTSYGGDIYRTSGESNIVEVYSLCREGEFYDGVGAKDRQLLDCFQCAEFSLATFFADMSDAYHSGCSSCDVLTPFSCCGAVECSASATTCSGIELTLCPPSPQPTSAPSKPTLTPTPPPSGHPSLVPTHSPTFLPSQIPTNLPSPLPTVHCDPGFFLNNQDQCEKCGVGTYSNVTQPPWPRECTVCDFGRVSLSLGRLQCGACPVGTFSSATRDECRACQIGEFVLNASTCEVCPVGKYAPSPLNDDCLECGPGFATGMTSAATTCGDCPPGTFSAGLTSFCGICAVGKFSGTRSGACVNCSAGSYADANASSTCTNCESGYAAPIAGMSACPACPAGTISRSRAAECELCTAGSFSEVEGSASCSDCPGNSYSTEAATTCRLCLKGFYYTLDGVCKECAEGVDCSFDGSSTQEFLTLGVDYWRISALASQVYLCELPEACKGGSGRAASARRLSSEAFTSDSYCNEGYSGPLCSTCVSVEGGSKYFLRSQKCKLCSDQYDYKTLIDFITIPTVLCFLALVFLTIAYCFARVLKPKLSSKVADEIFEKLTGRLAQESDSSKVNDDGSMDFTKQQPSTATKILAKDIVVTSLPSAIVTDVTIKLTEGHVYTMKTTTVQKRNILDALSASKKSFKRMQTEGKAVVAFYQICGNVGFNYTIKWPENVEIVVSALQSIFNLDLLPSMGLNCYATRFDYIDKMIAVTIAPLVITALLFISYILVRLKQKLKLKKEIAKNKSYEIDDQVAGYFSSKEISTLQEVFAEYDSNRSGVLEMDNLTKIIRKFSPELTDLELEEKTQRVFKIGDVNDDGIISFTEFLTAMHNSRNGQRKTSFSELVDKKVEAKVAKVAGQNLFYAFLVLTFLVLVNTSTILFNYFKCRRFSEAVGGAEYYLFRDYSVDCHSRRYKVNFWFAMVMVMVYPVGIPLLYATLLYNHRNVLKDKEKMSHEAIHGYPTTGHLRFLTDPYKPEFFYFELVECSRRLLLASIIGIVAPDSASSPVIGLCICLFFNLLFTLYLPFKDSSSNILTVTLAYSLTFFFTGALMIKADISRDGNSDQEVFGWLLIVVLFLGPAAFLILFSKRNVSFLRDNGFTSGDNGGVDAGVDHNLMKREKKEREKEAARLEEHKRQERQIESAHSILIRGVKAGSTADVSPSSGSEKIVESGGSSCRNSREEVVEGDGSTFIPFEPPGTGSDNDAGCSGVSGSGEGLELRKTQRSTERGVNNKKSGRSSHIRSMDRWEESADVKL